MDNFIDQLKRRKVFRVAGVYALVAWLLTQIIVAVEGPLNLPGWMDTAVILLLGLGFPIAVILAYAFEVTLEDETQGASPRTDGGATGTAKSYIGIVGAASTAIALLYLWGFNTIPGLGTSTAANAAIDVTQPVPGFSGRAAIAVLPFVNISDDPEQEYLADGITEDIITGLQAYQSFPIIARTSTFTYKNKTQNVRQIAAELGAGYILEGSVRRVGQNVRITGQLINADGIHLWAERFDVPWHEVITLQDTITAKILHAIEPEIAMSEADRARYVRTGDMEAFDYYLRARAHGAIDLGFTDLNGLPITAERLEEARGWAHKAIEKDPDFAAAYTLLGHIDGSYVFQLRAKTSDEDVAAALVRAISNSEKARLISPFEPTACSCLALLYLAKGDRGRAALLQEEAVLVNPSNAIVHAALAKILHVQGDHDRALQEINMAMRLSPKDMAQSTYLAIKAAIEQSHGEFDSAAALAARSILESPGNHYGHIIRITSLYAAGRPAAAMQALEDLHANFPGFTPPNTWNEQFPDSVIQAVDQPLQSKLTGTAYDTGVQLILEAIQAEGSSS